MYCCKLRGIVVSSFVVGLMVVCAGLVLSLSATPALAQATSTGTVSGQVTDPQNAAVVGAEVKMFDPSRNFSKSTTTNETGRFIFVNVEPGIYDVTVNKAGFATAKVQGQRVEVGLALTLNITLQLGSTSTIIEVQASAGAELQTMNATVGTTMNFQSLIALPNLGRDASTLVELQPAVTPNGAVAGAVRDQNTFQLDGANNSNDMDGTMNTYTPSYASNGGPTGVMPTPVESIEEFKVGTVGQTADFNASSGGQISMVTRRGTNQWHGTLYEFYFASNFGAANNWRNNHTPDPIRGLPYTPIPPAHYNRFGVAGGGPLLPRFWGGKTYIFANWEAFRYTNATNYERSTPTALMRAGVVSIQNSAGVYQQYNLNPVPVTVNGVTYPVAQCPAGACDPRGLGLNPIVKQIWDKYMPLPNDPTFGDQVNTQGYLAAVAIPQKSALLATRLDHDFSEKMRFMATYRYYGFTQLTTSQVDIGGALPGDQFGVPAAQAPRPQKPHSITAGLTSTITPNLTNDFRANYLRNWWQWSTAAAPPQLPGLGGALEIGGESANALIPYNVNTQSVRQRFWDGQDQYYRDDMSLLHGNHLFQFGALYQRNFEYHSRNDNGQGIMTSVVYQSAANAGNMLPGYIPTGVPANQVSNWTSLYNQVTGIVTQPQVVYTRAGTNLALQPLGTQAFDQSIIPTYNVYFSDTWRVRPTFTLTYGLGYALELPPYEINGKQVALVDGGNNLISAEDYLAQRLKAAQNGQVYNPQIGFATVRNIGQGLKYPYEPFYGEFSPRISAAWNPKFGSGLLGSVFGDGKTVIRGGYSRLYGRLNGVGLVLIPLLGTGLLQAVSCIGATIQNTCPGNAGNDPVNAFRIGKDGLSAPLGAASPTLPQPYFPGVGGNLVAGDGTVLDPRTKPNRSDQFNFTIQRALTSKMMFEIGYIGRIIKNEFQQIDLDSVDTRLTLNGQSFMNAWANLFNAVNSGATTFQAQPWFEQALGGVGSAYCAGSPSCTAAVASKQKSSIAAGQVYTVYRNLEGQKGWTLGPTQINSPLPFQPGVGGTQATSVFVNLSNGYGNYNAGFFSFSAHNFHGLTARSNFTWSKALGTGAVTQSTSSYSVVDPFNISAMYGPQSFDYKFLYNLVMVYEPPFFKSQKGIVGHILGGWSIAPLFTAQTGAPLRVGVGSNCQTFGEMNCSSGSTNENAAAAAPYTGGASAKYNVTPTTGAGINGNPAIVKGASGMNMFSDPNAVYQQFRRPVLGQDVNQSGAGIIRALPTWNLDLALHKDIRVTERIGAMLMFQVTNVLNHFQPSTPGLNIDSPQTWGVITSQANTPRNMAFGLRVRF